MYKRGTKCQICVGCGRCSEGISFVVQNYQSGELGKVVLPSIGKRLVTVDIGTTTIAMQLHNIDGSVADFHVQVNPQIKYGADVLSRIQASKDGDKASDMQELVRAVLRQGFQKFRSCLAEGEEMVAIVAANTTMSYLFMGFDPGELGQAPFKTSHLAYDRFVWEDVECILLPRLSAFVGGDIVAGMRACEMWSREEITLLIDLGTNGEMVLGNRERMTACATAAGPAFEGGVNRGIWGADMIRLLAKLLQDEVMDETGLLADPYFDTGIRIGDVLVTQESVRSIQLAKGAIRAGIEILLKEYGIKMEDIDRVVLAGGFGYYLNKEAAATIGLLPKVLVEKTVTGGNTALFGALQFGASFLREGESAFHIPKSVKVQILNLAQVPEFEPLFYESVNFC